MSRDSQLGAIPQIPKAMRFEYFRQLLNFYAKQQVVDSPVLESQTRKGQQTRRAILDAAVLRFARSGYRSTSVADIARDAGLGGTIAFAYFKNKEALFLAAVDQDVAAHIHTGLAWVNNSATPEHAAVADWQQRLFFTLVETSEQHPLSRRLLGGLEPEVTERVLEIPALKELRAACATRLQSEQTAGTIRPDVDPLVMANGIVAIMLALLMSVVQLGSSATTGYATEVAAVFAAALRPPPAQN
ncbi:MAG: TetR/AcrR family transcriptional regulator [Actinomycetes bacterium]